MATPKKTTEEKVLANVAKDFQITAVATPLNSEIISEELDGLGSIPFDRAKIPTGGNTNFEIPDEDDDDNLISTPEIVGVIVYHHPANGRWEKGYDGSSEPPVCSSSNGKTGLNISTGEVLNCANCPFNQYGSGEQNNSKACKNVHRVFVLRSGNPVPLLLTLPPTSLGSMRNYIAKKLLLQGMKSNQVITKITLKKEKSKSNMPYSKVVFEKVGMLNDEQLKSVESMHSAIKSLEEAEAVITSDDYNTQPVEQSVSIDVEVEDDVPEKVEATVAEPIAEPITKAPAKNNNAPAVNFDFLDPTTPTTDDGNPFA